MTNQQTALEGLEPCPFCGGKAAVFSGVCMMPGSFDVQCTQCKCGTGYWSRAKAIANWNRRAPAALAAQGAGSADSVAVYGIRRKGTKAIIGIVPNKIAAKPATRDEYLRDYEEVPLYERAAAPQPLAGGG